MLICNISLVRALIRIERERARMMHDIVFRRTQRVGMKLTKMLLVCTFYFLIATVPVSVYFIVDPYKRQKYDADNDKYNMAILDFVKTPTYLLQYSNYSVNFYLYSLTNAKFWRKLKIACGCHKGQLSSLSQT
ncbi:hypothetical protein CHS0354_032338 [Potamilus streckersoni]|uniref:G-protein coupled receptors family 1 profile domain-containing protein n=1 Tax=Potamilus streckersoni TaxID=2493646 RepID=A0AAE0THC7_9BIVA|nr:hypothetical protein CHS0354_032338 [Potamilus streckersoni]